MINFSIIPKIERYYKYQAITMNSITNLSNNQLCFRNPKDFDFSDPDDCKIHIYYEGTRKQWIEHYKGLVDEAEMNNILDIGLDNNFFQCNNGLILYDPEYEGHSKDYLDSLHGGIHTNNLPLVACFCKEPDNAYMWREYADNHKGFCLCFKSNSMNLFSGNHTFTVDSKTEYFCPVEYEMAPQNRLNLLNLDDVNKIGKCLTTKKLKYVNEKEYRILIYKQTNLKRYEKEDLEGIIFGFEADLKKEKEIYELAQRVYGNINFYKVADIQDGKKVRIPIDGDYFKSIK